MGNLYAQTKTNENHLIAHKHSTPKYSFLLFHLFKPLMNFFTPKRSDRQNRLKSQRKGKYAVLSASFANRGSATIEAVCTVPIMLFAFWAFYSIGQIYILENQVYQAAMNTAVCLAEYTYAAEQTDMESVGHVLAYDKFQEYLSEDPRIKQYIANGKSGIRISLQPELDEQGFLCLQAAYRIHIPVPVLQDLSVPIRIQVRQKAYTGYQPDQADAEDETYVYLAEYSSVYHLSRNCSHLKLTIFPVSKAMLDTAYAGRKPCAYCGTCETAMYYIANTGECYHTSLQCSGLKRTVRRVKKREAQGYAPCSRCSGG